MENRPWSRSRSSPLSLSPPVLLCPPPPLIPRSNRGRMRKARPTTGNNGSRAFALPLAAQSQLRITLRSARMKSSRGYRARARTRAPATALNLRIHDRESRSIRMPRGYALRFSDDVAPDGGNGPRSRYRRLPIALYRYVPTRSILLYTPAATVGAHRVVVASRCDLRIYSRRRSRRPLSSGVSSRAIESRSLGDVNTTLCVVFFLLFQLA